MDVDRGVPIHSESVGTKGEFIMSLLPRIEQYLRKTGKTASRFGKDVAGDPRLVFDMRRGRAPLRNLSNRIEALLIGAAQ
jgi:hypothetical protein